MLGNEILNQYLEAHREEVKRALLEFKKKFGISFIVSISGGAEDHNMGYATEVVSQLLDGLKDCPCAILTGGTQGGIPEEATRIARMNKLPTIGVFPPKGRKYALLDQLDLPIETLSPSIGPAGFGSETPSFAQLPDYAVFIGGSLGTLIEATTMLKGNTKRIKDKEIPIYICPIEGSERAAALIPLLAHLEPSLAYCLPAYDLRSGSAAAEFIKDNYQNR